MIYVHIENSSQLSSQLWNGKKSINMDIFYIVTNIFQNNIFYILVVNPIQDEHFRGDSRIGGVKRPPP